MEASKCASKMCIFPDWNKRLIKESYIEESQSQIKLLRDEGRNAVWEMCSWFGFQANGAPGLACRILEHYLFVVFNAYPNGVNLTEFREALQNEMPLLIASCITLTCKMNNSTLPISAKAVQVVLTCKYIPCSVKNIIASEFKVFSAIGFRIPLWTAVDTGIMLAMEVGFPVKGLPKIDLVVDLAEFRRHRINKRVQCIFNMGPHLTIGNVVVLHLTAGAVAATAELFNYSIANIVLRLAQLTEASSFYIKSIRDVICVEVQPDIQKGAKRSPKRK